MSTCMSITRGMFSNCSIRGNHVNDIQGFWGYA
jgi:hypothetical protein